MKKFSYTIVHPQKLNKQTYQEIITLHKSIYSLPDELIIALLHERDEVLLYRDLKTYKLIGTVGISRFIIDKSAIAYIGNTVTHPEYYNESILLHAQVHNFKCMLKKYFFKKKIICGFSTSNSAFKWASHFPEHWPNEHDMTPKYYQELMIKIAEKLVGNNNFRIEKTFLINEKFRNLLKQYNCQNIFLDNRQYFNDNYFARNNPNAHLGEQLLVLGPINFRNTLTAIKYLWEVYNSHSV